MISLQSRMHLDGVTARQITDFLLNPRDDTYRAWWPGTHLQFHVIRPVPGDDHVGDLVWMDELVGSRRVSMAAEVVEAVPGARVVWRLRRWGVRLPIRVIVRLEADEAGVTLCHTIAAGWPGPGRILDPLWRHYFSASFADAMDEHARTEFRLLCDLLRADHVEQSARPPSAAERLTGTAPTKVPGRGTCGPADRAHSGV